MNRKRHLKSHPTGSLIQLKVSKIRCGDPSQHPQSGIAQDGVGLTGVMDFRHHAPAAGRAGMALAATDQKQIASLWRPPSGLPL